MNMWSPENNQKCDVGFGDVFEGDVPQALWAYGTITGI